MKSPQPTVIHSLLLAPWLLLLLWQPAPGRALTWNWTFRSGEILGPPSLSGSGTFTTDGTSFQANTTYEITGISGTFIDTNRTGTVNTITGLGDENSIPPAPYFLRWDGSASSPIITDILGISFKFTGSSTIGPNPGPFNDTANLYNSPALNTYNPVNRITSDILYGGGSGEVIASSTLIPANAVPGPLPLMGAAAAFGWSRRLRRRVSGRTRSHGN